QILGLPRPLLALVPAGAILLLLGLAVLFNKGAQGLVEVIFGIAMIAVPIVLTAQQRRTMREHEERERATHEAREKRDRELLGSYLAALEKMRETPDAESMEAVGRERSRIDLPDPVRSP